jgi:para-nitrobenzyl esterase
MAKTYALPPLQDMGGDTIYDPARMSEDCLYLNIWAPATGHNHPVYVWIHGGGNAGGSANMEPLNGESFARNGIVCVTVGYRVGAAGFLDLTELLGGDYTGSGNNGLKDQAAALHWIHNNIRAFGGNLEHITIGGQSAGAKNVAALLSAPDHLPPIAQAISHSGSGHTVHRPETAHAITRLFMQAAAISNPRDLMTLSPEAILQAQRRLALLVNCNYPFRPVVDRKFLSLRPVNAFASGVTRPKRLLIGTTRDEILPFDPAPENGARFSQRQLSNVALADFETVFARYMTRLKGLDPLALRWRALTAEEYWLPSVRLAENHAKNGGDVRMYRYDRPLPDGEFKGYAVHGSDLDGAWGLAQHPLGKAMHTLWCDFIKGGAPRTASVPAWPRYTMESRLTMLFNETSTLANDPRGEERALWGGIL